MTNSMIEALVKEIGRLQDALGDDGDYSSDVRLAEREYQRAVDSRVEAQQRLYDAEAVLAAWDRAALSSFEEEVETVKQSAAPHHGIKLYTHLNPGGAYNNLAPHYPYTYDYDQTTEEAQGVHPGAKQSRGHRHNAD